MDRLPAALHQSFHPPPPSSHHMSSLQTQPDPPQQQAFHDTDRARAYKSRNKRPCDFCR